MLKKLLGCTALFIFVMLITFKEAEAVTDPLETPNNKFGIHILNDTDLDDAANLVNSSGGDWGYVTIVIRTDERDQKRWQGIFDKMRRLHLIPIVRIATKMTGEGWEKPNKGELDGWVSFLNELNWVIKNRYVVIGNEPNHAAEWGGEVNPTEYAEYLRDFSGKLKEKSPDFFILNAGLDASAPNGKESMSEDLFLQKMYQYDNNIFNMLDGWSTHSYPNPGFAGTQDDKGRGTVETFKWELGLLDALGFRKNLPVFITETGWKHDLEDVTNATNRLKASYQIAWSDNRIVAITPFVLNYQNPPFNIFSWKKENGEFYEIYEEFKQIPKTNGQPIQKESVNVVSVILPPIIPSDGKLTGFVSVKNEGQTIWDGNQTIYTNKGNLQVQIDPMVFLSNVEPGEKTVALYKVDYK